MPTYLLLLCLAFGSISSWAQSDSGNADYDDLYESTDPDGAFRLFSSIALKAGQGTGTSEDEIIAEARSLYRYGVEGNLALRIRSFLIGATAEYNLWRQSTSPSDVSDTNLSGNQTSAGLLIGKGLGRFLLVGKWFFYSKLTLAEKDVLGADVVYTSPANPWAVQLNYKIGSSSYLGLEYVHVSYDENEVSGSESPLNESITYSGWGVVYGLLF